MTEMQTRPIDEQLAAIYQSLLNASRALQDGIEEAVPGIIADLQWMVLDLADDLNVTIPEFDDDGR